MIKAIETQYKGYRFRSRLEARWAVFFDALGIEWEYEKEGYDLGEAGWYLPDFWLPEYGSFFEVKAHRNISRREWDVAQALSEFHPVTIMIGTPGKDIKYEGNSFYGLHAYTVGTKTYAQPLYCETIIMEGMPPMMPKKRITFDDMPGCFDEYKGGGWGIFFSGPGTFNTSIGVDEQKKIKGFLFSPNGQITIDARMVCWHERLDGSFTLWNYPSVWHDGNKPKMIDTPRLKAAYQAARSARFEHGESPR